jgi:NitT/TauT family transport system substrate-binding protein
MPGLWGSVLCAAAILMLACTAGPPGTRSALDPSAPPAAQQALPAPPAVQSPQAASTGTVAGAIAASTTPARTSLPPLTAPIEVKIGVQGSVSDAGFYIAMARGYFQELGLDATLETFSAGAAEYVQFIATNQLQVGGPASVPALYNAADRGAVVYVVADKGTFQPGFAHIRLSGRKNLYDSGQVRGLEDLKGRTIAIAAPYSAAHSIASLSLRRIGLRDEDTNIIPVPNPDHIAALANGAVDAAVSLEPIPTLAVQQGVAVILAEGYTLRPNMQVGLVAFSPQLFENRPAALRFVTAYLRAVRDYNDAFSRDVNKDEIIAILATNTNLKDPAAYAQVVMAGLDPRGTLNIASLQEDFDWLKSVGQLPQTLPFPASMFDQTLVREADEILGPYP